jgi:predicted  nucleic acid-binding Zn-ribbon protein
MPAINDYKCVKCGYIADNLMLKPSRGCDSCGSDMEITFQNWHGMKFNKVREFLSDNDETRVDEKGFVRKFKVEDDRVCQIELGMNVTQSEAGLRTFDTDKSMHYMGKFLREGDSPRLRKEILEERSKGQAEFNKEFK